MTPAASSPAAGHALSDRHALVTGASRGIGLAIATALAKAGAAVHLVARGEADLARAADAVGNGAVVHRADITNAADVAALVDEMRSVSGGAPDILVSNAGLFPLGAIEQTAVTTFEATIEANLVAPFRLLHAWLPVMRERGSGHVVTIGSVADRNIYPGNGAYSASKFGQRALHEVLRAELRGSGVRATLIAPAATDTPIWDAIDPDNRDDLPNRADMLHADDVANAVVWAVTQRSAVNIDEVRLSVS